MELLDKEVVLKHILHATPYKTEVEAFFWNLINSLPTIDPSGTVNRGRWINDGPNIICSECKAEYSDEIVFMLRNLGNNKLMFCSNCGARMED